MRYSFPSSRAARVRSAASLAVALVAACAPSPVEWVEGRVDESRGEVLAIDTTGRAMLRAAAPIPIASVPSADACPGSLQLASAGADGLYGVWWSPRPDRSVKLMSALSADGGATWQNPVPVDTTDRGQRGCARPPAGVAADSSSGYVHVVYYVEGPDGPGLFFSHSMDRGMLFHEPVPVVYGPGPVSAAVASDGNTVVVAYEDPNTARPRIGLQLSRTMGHLFEERLPVISSGNAASSEPAVAVRGRTIAVGWIERPTGSGAGDSGVRVVRVGEIR